MLGSLVRLVAPDVPPVQDLQHHWRAFLEYYSQRALAQLKEEPMERTNLAFHLNKMLSHLMKEQEDCTEEELPPCLEYVLHQDILNILVTLCQADTPPGIRPYIFRVFIFLVDQVKYPLLAETAGHLPLCRLTLVCSLTKASPTEGQEMQFLSSLCHKVASDAQYIQVFLSDPRLKNVSDSSLCSSRSSRSNSIINLQQIESLALNVKQALESVKSRHYLMTALLNYIDSADYCLSCTAMENIITISSLENEISGQCLLEGSPFLDTLSGRLVGLLDNVPPTIPPERIEELYVQWKDAHTLHHKDYEKDDFLGRAELIAYLSFLDYVDKLVANSRPMIGHQLADAVRHSLLETSLTERIMSTRDENLMSGLSVLSVTWSHMTSSKLQGQFATWFMNHPTQQDGIAVADKIFALWNNEDVEDELVRVEAMRLFDIFLEHPAEAILNSLVISFLENRGYYHLSKSESEAASWSDVEDERERTKLQQAQDVQKIANDKLGPSKTLAPSNIHRVVNMWLYLVNDELRLDEFRGSGYDSYVKDANRQVKELCQLCGSFSSWPLEATSPPCTNLSQADTVSDDSRSESDPSRQFYPGPLISRLLDKLEKCLDTSYDTNLQITALLSKLCQLPHPYVHEYLLNPTIAVEDGTRTLYTTLRAVLNDAMTRTVNVQHFPKRISLARKCLLGGDEKSMQALNGEVHDEKTQDFLFAVVVLDEFCKELAAISLVKYHLFTTEM